MIKITLNYLDFDDNPREEDVWFHLSEAEIVEWHLTHDGEDLTDFINRIIAETNKKELIRLFKELLVRSVGRRSPDGRRFEKSDDITADFMQTNAYSDLFMRLATDAKYGATFVNGIVPKDLLKKVEAIKNGEMAYPDKKVDTIEMPTQITTIEAPKQEDKRPKWEQEGRLPTKQELMAMTPAEIAYAMNNRNNVPAS